MFFILIAIAIGLVLVIELFYFRHAMGKCLAYWGFDTKSKKIMAIKYSIIAVIMGASIGLFTVVGMAALYFLLCAMITEGVCLLIKLIAKRDFRVTRFLSSTLILPLVIGISTVVYGYANMYNVRATEYTVTSEKTLGRDYKIAFLSDLHAGVSLDFEELGKVCEEISQCGADMLLLGGDIVDESTTKEQMRKAFELLGSVKTEYGVFYVDGNHDIPRGPVTTKDDFSAQELNEAIEGAGIKILRDEVVNLGDDLVLIGHRDASFHGNEEITERETIENLMAKADEERYAVLVEHQPREYDRCKAAGVNLMLSGHTHAGQIWPAGLFITVVAPNEQNYGIETDGDFSAIVSSGIAGWSFPIKTEKYAEYVLVTIAKTK